MLRKSSMVSSPRARTNFRVNICRPHAERVAWLTGFTGSAGAAIILAGKAVVMSDGRYTEQLKMEVDGALYALSG